MWNTFRTPHSPITITNYAWWPHSAGLTFVSDLRPFMSFNIRPSLINARLYLIMRWPTSSYANNRSLQSLALPYVVFVAYTVASAVVRDQLGTDELNDC